jgi:hypothetical protein
MEKLAIFKKIASVLVLPVLIIGILIYHSWRMIHTGNSLSEEYSLIEKRDSINNVVINIYFPDGFKDTPSTKLIVLSNGSKRTLFAKEDSVLRSISDVIKVGTIITKQKDNDTVVLTNITSSDTAVYYFKILNSDFK